MKMAIEKELKLANLQVIDITVTKIIQLFETKNSRSASTHLHCFDCLLYKLHSLPSCCRHAVMIVGQSGSGKSVTWKMLRNTLTRLNKEKKGPYQSVKVCTNNALYITREHCGG